MKDKSPRWGLWLLSAGALLLAGCGGIRGNYQGTPASLLLLKVEPAPLRSPSVLAPVTGGVSPAVATVD